MSARPEEPFWAGDTIRWRRSADEIRAECAKLNAKAAALAGREDLTKIEQGIIGIWVAAAWTTGESPSSPMTRAAARLDGTHLLQEIRLAQALSADMSMPTFAYACGVMVWLGWITGIRDKVLYPDEA